MNRRSNLSDGELIARFKDGDATALDALVHRHEMALAGFLHRMVHDRALADDLFQETFLRIMRRLPSYREEGRFTSWMFGIARNVALDALRRSRFEQELFRRPMASSPDQATAQPADEGAADPRYGPDMQVERLEWAERLEAAIIDLPAEQREVVALRYGAGLTFREIAEITETSINTALGRMRYATVALRRKLGVAAREDRNDDTP